MLRVLIGASGARQSEINLLYTQVTQELEQEDFRTDYLSKLTDVPLLSAEEEARLARASRAGDKCARQKLVESNMRLVVNIARSYRSRRVPLEDLVQEGAIGLMQAIERFDPGKGFRFSTYATHWVRQAISRSLDTKSKLIRVPSHVAQALRKVERERQRLARELGQDPTHEQLAKSMGLSLSRLNNLLDASHELVSLDARVGDSGNTMVNLLPDASNEGADVALIRKERCREYFEVLDELTERERAIMTPRMQVSDPEEIKQVRERLAIEMKLSHERVRQIELHAIKKLRIMAQQKRVQDIFQS